MTELNWFISPRTSAKKWIDKLSICPSIMRLKGLGGGFTACKFWRLWRMFLPTYPTKMDLEFCVLGRGTRIAANLMLGPQFTLCTEPFLGCVLSWSVVSILRCVVLKTRLYYACGWECDRDRCRPQAWQEERLRGRFATPESFPQSACCF